MNPMQALREENEELRERIRQLEAALHPKLSVPAEWGLAPAEGRIFRLLVDREMATYEALCIAARHLENRDVASNLAAQVHIARIRRKLLPFPVRILNIWGVGYRMHPDDRARLRLELAPLREAA